MRTSTFALIIGPTAVGKNTVLEAVLERLPEARHVLSTTCRGPRPGEVDGRDYHFLSCEAFQERVAEGDFFEHARYSNHWYGTSRSNLARTMAGHPLAIKIVEIQGARIIKRKMPEALTIFITPGAFSDSPAAGTCAPPKKACASTPRTAPAASRPPAARSPRPANATASSPTGKAASKPPSPRSRLS